MKLSVHAFHGDLIQVLRSSLLVPLQNKACDCDIIGMRRVAILKEFVCKLFKIFNGLTAISDLRFRHNQLASHSSSNVHRLLFDVF
ncbi:hypothetical protein D3C85_1273880 [compost metagenome]